VNGNNFLGVDGKEDGLWFLCYGRGKKLTLLKQLFVGLEKKGMGC
jgi:hypothetical protein